MTQAAKRRVDNVAPLKRCLLENTDESNHIEYARCLRRSTDEDIASSFLFLVLI